MVTEFTELPAKFLLFGGVVGATATLAHGDLKSNLVARLTTPAAPDKEASRLLLMSRPPLLTRRGLRLPENSAIPEIAPSFLC